MSLLRVVAGHTWKLFPFYIVYIIRLWYNMSNELAEWFIVEPYNSCLIMRLLDLPSIAYYWVLLYELPDKLIVLIYSTDQRTYWTGHLDLHQNPLRVFSGATTAQRLAVSTWQQELWGMVVLLGAHLSFTLRCDTVKKKIEVHWMWAHIWTCSSIYGHDCPQTLDCWSRGKSEEWTEQPEVTWGLPRLHQTPGERPNYSCVWSALTLFVTLILQCYFYTCCGFSHRAASFPIPCCCLSDSTVEPGDFSLLAATLIISSLSYVSVF